MLFDHEIQFKQGKQNIVINTLSHKPIISCHTIISKVLPFSLYEAIRQTWEEDAQLKHICEAKEHDPQLFPNYIWYNVELCRNGKLMVENVANARQQLLKHFHGSSIEGHSGVLVIM